jgi:hypothetical protein
MGLIITITDGGNFQTDMLVGIKPRTSIKKVIAAGQLQFWDESQLVLSGTSTTGFTSFNSWPFTSGGTGGDCLFNTGSLFCFAGPVNADFDNVLMVLWNFPVKPQTDDEGDGQLNAPPADGLLADGPISWNIHFGP